jgi:hypothetical protein
MRYQPSALANQVNHLRRQDLTWGVVTRLFGGSLGTSWGYSAPRRLPLRRSNRSASAAAHARPNSSESRRSRARQLHTPRVKLRTCVQYEYHDSTQQRPALILLMVSNASLLTKIEQLLRCSSDARVAPTRLFTRWSDYFREAHRADAISEIIIHAKPVQTAARGRETCGECNVVRGAVITPAAAASITTNCRLISESHKIAETTANPTITGDTRTTMPGVSWAARRIKPTGSSYPDKHVRYAAIERKQPGNARRIVAPINTPYRMNRGLIRSPRTGRTMASSLPIRDSLVSLDNSIEEPAGGRFQRIFLVVRRGYREKCLQLLW